jgi:hypothetical protein
MHWKELVVWKKAHVMVLEIFLGYDIIEQVFEGIL